MLMDNPENYHMSLEEMQKEVYEVNVVNGWFDSDRTFGDDIALMHSEVSEALEAFRQWGIVDVTPTMMIDGSNLKSMPKPEGVGSEFADVLVRLLDSCQRYGIDLEKEFHRKIAYNKTRGYHHGGKTL